MVEFTAFRLTGNHSVFFKIKVLSNWVIHSGKYQSYLFIRNSMNKNLLLPCVVLLCAGFSVNANNHVLSVDQVALQGMQFAFENDAHIKPKNSDFTLLNTVLMSSEQGHRVAVVTVRNDASGSRILEGAHLMALFADGQRKAPLSMSEGIKLVGGEQRSFTVSFGEADYPILSVYSSNDIN